MAGEQDRRRDPLRHRGSEVFEDQQLVFRVPIPDHTAEQREHQHRGAAGDEHPRHVLALLGALQHREHERHRGDRAAHERDRARRVEPTELRRGERAGAHRYIM
jgi:hypothetical protein